MIDIALIVVAYLLGSISTAIITCKLMGLPDPRGVGSGNPGATNVLRAGGKKAAIITLLGDLLKGLAPVLVARYLDMDDLTIAAVALAAFLGHLFPIYFKFKGGKGVATALGVIIGMDWMVGIITIVTWLLMAKLFKYSSLAALTASALAPIWMLLISESLWLTLATLIATVLIFWRHQSNIRNLMNGTEGKIGKKK